MIKEIIENYGLDVNNKNNIDLGFANDWGLGMNDVFVLLRKHRFPGHYYDSKPHNPFLVEYVFEIMDPITKELFTVTYKIRK